MTAAAHLGNDVIGLPGQCLDVAELTHLVKLADGQTPREIERATGADRLRQQQLESTLRAKLGARTKTHMIARGFVLGVIAPRALCLLLAALSINAAPGDHFSTRAPKRSRTPATAMRTSRSTRASHGGDGGGNLPHQFVIESRVAC